MTATRLARMLAVAALAVAATTSVRAAEPYLNRDGHACSGSYRQSGDYCVPKDEGSAASVPKPPGAQCPSGWRDSGGWACEKMR
jgi:hypothetical protein